VRVRTTPLIPDRFAKADRRGPTVGAAKPKDQLRLLRGIAIGRRIDRKTDEQSFSSSESQWPRFIEGHSDRLVLADGCQRGFDQG